MGTTPPPAADRPLRLATRGSPLARHQADLVAALLVAAEPSLVVETVVVHTEGDRRTDVPLDQIGGQGVFVKEVQAALLEDRADVAVHSAKDLPAVTPPGLVLAAVPERADPRDALVGRRLADLPAGASVGTGSARRRAQLANLRPDLTFVELRGNMDTRVGRGEDGSVDAVVVAAAALERLGWAHRWSEVLSPAVMLPQVGQGALALECRADDPVAAALLAQVDHPDSHRALVAERSLLQALGASCSLPVGGWARPGPDGLVLEGLVASGDGRMVLRAQRSGHHPAALGAALAEYLLGECGGSFLADWEPGGPAEPRR